MYKDPIPFRYKDPAAPDMPALIVIFRERPEKNEKASAEAGYDVFDSLLIAYVGPPGGARSNAACEIERKLPDGTVKVHPVHAKKYADLVKAYKEGNGELGVGTPLATLPGMDAGIYETLRARGVHSIETLAELSDAGAGQMMGFRELQAKAKRFLEAREKGAPLAKMESALKERDDEIANLKRQVSDLIERFSDDKPAKRKAA